MVWQKVFGGARTADDTVSVTAARQRVDAQGAVLIDVREASEWTSGHAPGAQHIPLGQLAAHYATLPRDREIMLVCQSGARSGVATRMLRQQGFDRAVNVQGGMLAWQRYGLPVVRGK